jgi:hypothetical protein
MRGFLWKFASKLQTDPLPVLDVRYICSYNVHIGGEPLSTGSVFDIVYRTRADAAVKSVSPGYRCLPSPTRGVNWQKARTYAKYNSFKLRAFVLDPPQRSTIPMYARPMVWVLPRPTVAAWHGVLRSILPTPLLSGTLAGDATEDTEGSALLTPLCVLDALCGEAFSRWAWGPPAFAKPASAGEGRSAGFGSGDGRRATSPHPVASRSLPPYCARRRRWGET